jgi:hypothetical protein
MAFDKQVPDPLPEGVDLSGAPLNTPAPESSVHAEQPEAAPVIPAPDARPAPAGPAREHAPGMVTIYTVSPMGTLTIPPMGADGKAVVIDRHGTEVDEATAERAREAAAASGFRIREE